MESIDANMIRVIVTKCGREITRAIKPMDLQRQTDHRNAMLNCGTLDDSGAYIEIADVYFVEAAPA